MDLGEVIKIHEVDAPALPIPLPIEIDQNQDDDSEREVPAPVGPGTEKELHEVVPQQSRHGR
jgi:hypothetical protein